MQKLTILYHIPNPSATGADRWIYEGWRDAFVDLGHRFHEFTEYDDLWEKLEETKPDIFWTAYNMFDLVRRRDELKRIRSKGVRIFMRLDWPRKKDEVQVIREHEVADVYFDEREPESMREFERATGRKFHTVANAANKLLHYPGHFVEKYDYDIVYLGAKLPLKKWFFDNVLMPLTKRYRVGIFGPYWTVKDNILRAGTKLLRKVRFKAGVDFLNNRRILIPADEENLLYSSAKICLNFHEREEDGSQPHYILNQRTFKIPACGGFQICDHVPAIRKYFAEDEVVTAVYDPRDWFEKIEYFLEHEEERRRIQRKGTKRALKDHTYHNRVERILSLYRELQ